MVPIGDMGWGSYRRIWGGVPIGALWGAHRPRQLPEELLEVLIDFALGQHFLGGKRAVLGKRRRRWEGEEVLLSGGAFSGGGEWGLGEDKEGLGGVLRVWGIKWGLGGEIGVFREKRGI